FQIPKADAVAYRRSQMADWHMLLVIVAAQHIEIPTRPTMLWLFCKIISWQTEGCLFRVFCKVLLSQDTYIGFPFVVASELADDMQGKKRSTSAAFDESTRQFEIIFFSCYPIQTNHCNFDFFVSTSFVVRGI